MQEVCEKNTCILEIFAIFFCKTGVGCRIIVIKIALSLKIHSIFNILLFTNIKKYDTIL